MKPVDKKPPSGKGAPKHPVAGMSEIQRRYVTPAPKPKKEGKKK